MRNESPVLKAHPDDDDFLTTVRTCLSRRPRSLPPKLFYDARGSHLFDLICKTPEYYPTRTETAILDEFGADMANLIGTSCALIEFGSGSATKTPLLLHHLADNAVYVPIDICEDHLLQSTRRLMKMFPGMPIKPLCTDYTRISKLNIDDQNIGKRVIFFPGSTIGNYAPDDAVQLLRHAAQLTGRNGALLIGVDCKKSPALLNAAYNDAKGYTAAFNMNLLLRISNELGAQLDLEGYSHRAFYNDSLGRIEMHLVSLRKQHIRIGSDIFHFDKGETIHTENSYKYTAQEFQKLARRAGWHAKMLWADHGGMFNVHYLSLSATEPRHFPKFAH